MKNRTLLILTLLLIVGPWNPFWGGREASAEPNPPAASFSSRQIKAMENQTRALEEIANQLKKLNQRSCK